MWYNFVKTKNSDNYIIEEEQYTKGGPKMRTIGAIIKAILYVVFFVVIQGLTSFIYLIATLISKLRAADFESVTSKSVQDMLIQSAIELWDKMPILMIGSGIFMLVLLWIIFKMRHKSFAKEIHLKAIGASNIVPLILVGIALQFVATLAVELIPYPEIWIIDHQQAMDEAVNLKNIVMTICSVVIYAGVVEEVIFRGLVYTRLKRGMPVVVAAILSSILFGLIHGSPIQVLATILMGLLLVWVFEKFNSIVPCIIVHMANNLTAIVIAWASPIIESNMWTIIIYTMVMSAITMIAGIWLCKKQKAH